MTLGKKIIISLVTILMTICLGLNVWYILVCEFAPEKIVNKTYELGEITTVDGTSKQLIEIKIFTNENKNGLEIIELKFNNYLDETREEIYSQGIQFVGDTNESILCWDYQITDDEKANRIFIEETQDLEVRWAKNKYYGVYGSIVNGAGTSYYNYASANDFETSEISNTSPIVRDSKFLISIDDEMYMYKFKGTDIYDISLTGEKTLEYSDINLIYEAKENEYTLGLGYFDYLRYYFYQDPISFSKLMYEKFKGTAPGKQYVQISLFDDMFDYFKYDGSTYVQVTESTDIIKVQELVRTYMALKVEVVADGARVASDSMFGRIHGSETFNLTGEHIVDDYYYGKTIVNCDVYDFDYIYCEDGVYQLKLNDGFLKQYQAYSNVINLSVEINLDVLNAENVEFGGFVELSEIEQFVIYECYTIETIDGVVVRTEVEV